MAPKAKLDRKIPVRLLGLAAVAFVAAALCSILWPLRWRLAALWVAVEVCFSTFVFLPLYVELNAQPRPHRPKKEDAMATFERTLQYFRANPQLDYKNDYAGRWFLGAKFEDIKKGNAEEFLAYAFWYRTLQEMRDEGRGHVPAQMVAQLEQAWGLTLAPGYTPGLRWMGHLQEPLKAQWRPLAFYLCTDAVGWFARQMLRRWGFKQHTHQGMSFFTLNLVLDASGKAVSATRTSSCLSSLSDGSVTSSASSAASSSAAAAASPAFAGMSSKSSPPTMSASVPAPAATAAAASGTARAKSSPFQMAGLDWAAQLAANEDSLAASISAASAVHSPSAAPKHPFFAAAARAARAAAAARSSRRKAAAEQRAQQQQQAQRTAATATQPPLVPWLSTRTSVMLKALPNKLEQALSDGLGGKDMPVLFLHGVGGLAAYLEMLLQVMALGHPVIVVQFDAVAMRLSRVRTADEVMEAVVGVLDKLGVEKACVIGHSYGTFVAGRLARLHSKRVHSLCLIDPVCFGMFMPQLLSNFLYSTPRWRGLHHLVDFIKKGCVYIASHELHVCATFSRRFFWSDLNLWPEDLAPGSVVLLSGRDDLMNARQVQVMLQSAGHVRVMYDAELTHGEFLIKSEIKAAIMDEVRGMLARSGSAVVGLARPMLKTTMTLARNALGGGAVRMHTARGGTKYVRDDANNLVRTFTGNLTAMLQGMANAKPPSFAAAGARLPSKSVGGLAAATAAAAAAPAASTAGLVQMSSMPVRRKAARDTWMRAIFTAAPDAPKPTAVLPPMLPKGGLARRRSGSREAGRSSSSGGAPRKVVTMATDGVQVMAGVQCIAE